MIGKTVLLLAVLAGVAVAQSNIVSFTGDAYADFEGKPFVVKIADAQEGFETNCAGFPCRDVGVPEDLCLGFSGSTTNCPTSGWDIRHLFFQYDDVADVLRLGIDCFGVCGDADGDGLEGVTSPELAFLGGVDFADLGQVEGFALAIDFDLDVANVLPSFQLQIVPFDVIIGIPVGQPFGARQFPDLNAGQIPWLECTQNVANTSADFLSKSECFGLYNYQLTFDVNLASRFLNRVQTPSGSPWPTTQFNFAPSVSQPDFEWTISDVAALKALKGAPFSSGSRKEPWTILLQGFAGSFQDAGIGEDFMPSQTDYLEVNFPCLEVDVCDVCLGDGSTCLDCAGTPNGPLQYDVCDVCGGDGTSCRDCQFVPNGGATYDVCDVCNGNGQSCLDCAGIPNGGNVYDVCDVCGGDGSTCLDCAGVPNGPAMYNSCDQCSINGESSGCDDCLGVPNGPAQYDVCDVCNGNGQSCLDCAGTPNGGLVYDVCDVCGGDGTTCLDCANIPNGPNDYDICDVCGGFGQSCLDCAGIPNGPGQYDECGECNGDGTSCICDGALKAEICHFPDTLLYTECLEESIPGPNNQYTKETWYSHDLEARYVKYYERYTNNEVNENSINFSVVGSCPCNCNT